MAKTKARSQETERFGLLGRRLHAEEPLDAASVQAALATPYLGALAQDADNLVANSFMANRTAVADLSASRVLQGRAP